MSGEKLPLGWSIAKLAETISISGVISDGDWVESKDQDPNGAVRLIQLADIGDGSFKDKSNRFMSNERAEELRCTFLKEGDVLIARMPDPLGRACLFPGVGQHAVTVVDVCLIRTLNTSSINNKLLMYWTNSANIRNLISMQATGTTRRRITRKKLEVMEFPIPPLNEQTHIANKLDQLLAKVDAAKARLDKIPIILKRFRQSVLAAATSGRLTEEWRIEKGKTFDWQHVELLSVVEFKPKNGKSPKGVEFETKVKNLTLSAITPGYFVDGKFKYVDIEVVDDSYLWLKNGDILIQRANSIEYVGVSALYTGEDNKYIYPDLIMKCRANEKILPNYFHYSLLSESVRKYFRDNATGTAGNMPKINQQIVCAAPIHLPLLDEQTEIVRRVEDLFSFADTIEKQYQTAKNRVEKLTQSILAKAFRGELVPQDPNDEPAEVLLQRIRAEREQQKVKKPKVIKRTLTDTINVTDASM